MKSNYTVFNYPLKILTQYMHEKGSFKLLFLLIDYITLHLITNLISLIRKLVNQVKNYKYVN